MLSMGNLNLYSDLKYCFTNYNNLFIMLFKVTHVCNNIILKILVDNKYIYPNCHVLLGLGPLGNDPIIRHPKFCEHR